MRNYPVNFSKVSVVSKHLLLGAIATLLASCATAETMKDLAFDDTKPLQTRVKLALDTMCVGVFDDNAEIANWYSEYGVNSVANARGFQRRVREIVRSARASRTLFSLEERDLFNARYEALQDSYLDYKTELLLPLSGQSPKLCGDNVYCYEQSYEAVSNRADELEASMPVVPAQGLIDSLGPIAVIFNKAIGIAKGSCQKNMIRSMQPEYEELMSLELPEGSGI